MRGGSVDHHMIGKRKSMKILTVKKARLGLTLQYKIPGSLRAHKLFPKLPPGTHEKDLQGGEDAGALQSFLGLEACRRDLLLWERQGELASSCPGFSLMRSKKRPKPLGEEQKIMSSQSTGKDPLVRMVRKNLYSWGRGQDSVLSPRIPYQPIPLKFYHCRKDRKHSPRPATNTSHGLAATDRRGKNVEKNPFPRPGHKGPTKD